MEKDKAKLRYNFNPQDYAYMDDSIRREGWIWEFLRRNKEYKKDFETAICTITKKEDKKILLAKTWKLWNAFYDKYGLNVAKCPDNDCCKKKRDRIPSNQSRIIHNVTFFLPPDPDLSWPKVLAAYKEGIFGFNSNPIQSHSAKDLMQYHDLDIENKQDAHCFVNDVLTHSNKESTLYMGIDLSSSLSVDELADEVRERIVRHRAILHIPQRKAKRRCKKSADGGSNVLPYNAPVWASYLLIYDLCQIKRMKPKDIYQLLYIDHCDYRYFSVSTIQKKYNRAVELINGGYKIFLK